MKGHWSRTCCTANHSVELYQASLKEKGKNVEANFASQGDFDGDHLHSLGTTRLDVADFFDGNIDDFSDGKINPSVGDKNVHF